MVRPRFGLFALAIIGPWIAAGYCPAQTTVVEPGATPQGDMARGAGIFLAGAGWYDLNEAKAASLNAETQKKLYDWNEQIAQAYRAEYNAAVESDMRRRKLNDEAKKRFRAEREIRLRTKPNPDDIRKGDALNALLIDLSDPTIQSSAWRGAKIPLQEGISIKDLAFRFTPKAGAKENAALTKGLIALSRLDLQRGWPEYIPAGKLAKERNDYQSAYDQILKECLVGNLDSGSVNRLDGAIKKLVERAKVEVPTERGYRNEAVKTFKRMGETTNIFNPTTYSYAREMIADTNRHEAHTVGELLAFMRKYRLVFAQADDAPGGEEMYARLYGLMREQKEALGLKSEDVAVERPSPSDPSATTPAIRNADESMRQMDRFQGTWYFASNVVDGKDSPQIRRDKITMTYGGNRYTIRKNGVLSGSGTFSVDARKSPMEFTHKGDNGSIYAGIFKWDGEDMIRCGGSIRPDGFESFAGQHRELTRFTRSEP